MARGTTRVTLIHNPEAGGADHSGSSLVDLLSDAGYCVGYFNSKDCELARVLDEPAELIVAAGGDGTIDKIAREARANGPPLAVLPLGTANNIAASLGIDRPLDELVASWTARIARAFHPIDASGPWGRRRILEGIGFGAIAEAIADKPPKSCRSETRETYADAVIDAPPEQL